MQAKECRALITYIEGFAFFLTHFKEIFKCAIDIYGYLLGSYQSHDLMR